MTAGDAHVGTPIVVVPLDGSDHAAVALPVARELLRNGTLHLVHVEEAPSTPADMAEHLAGAAVPGAVLHAEAGEPAAGILRTAREVGASLVVMCTHTAAAPAGKTIGRTALAVLEGAPCPVVLVRPERGPAPWALRRILLPHDGTPTTSAAIQPAAALARSAGAEIVVLYVATEGTPPTERGSLTPPRYLDQPQHEWPAWAGEFLERLGCLCPLQSLRVRMVLGHGAPADEVLRLSAEQPTDLVVLAWRGVWEGHHAATVKAVIRGATCPVMVVRAAG